MRRIFWRAGSQFSEELQSGRPLPIDLVAQALFLCAQLRCEFLAKVLRFEDRANLDLCILTGHWIRTSAHPLEPGIRPASEFLVALTITITRIVCSFQLGEGAEE
jgi:hypothetical protein